MRKVSMTARDELVNALARRYAVAGRAEKARILDEFVAITGFHRKHAMRLPRCDAAVRRSEAKASRRIYDEAVCEAMVVPWEASDRICGKRLKALMPILVEAMERHGHPGLGPEIRAAVRAMSASTIDRSLREVREQASGRKRRRTAAPSSVRKSIPVRNFPDWDDPPPGFVEAGLVAHSGPVTRGSFVQTLVLTDIATGWTGCAPLPYREQTLLREVLGDVRRRAGRCPQAAAVRTARFRHGQRQRFRERDGARVLPGFRDRFHPLPSVAQERPGLCRAEEWRYRPPHRRLPPPRGSGSRRRPAAPSRLYTTTRLFVNFFQPSFKLASKRRDGVRVSKRYHAPATPCQRLLADPRTPPEVCGRVAELSARPSTRSGCRADADAGAATEPNIHRCGNRALWISPTSRLPRRRTRPYRRWSNSLPDCASRGGKAKQGPRPYRWRSRSAADGGPIRW